MAVSYYGGEVAAMADETPRCPVMLHFGENDHAIPMTDVERVRAAHPELPLFTYPAGHGFSCDERGSFDADQLRGLARRPIQRRHVALAGHREPWERQDRALSGGAHRVADALGHVGVG